MMNNMLLNQQQNFFPQQQQYHANIAMMQSLPPQMYFNSPNPPYGQLLPNNSSFPLTHSQVGVMNPNTSPVQLQNKPLLPNKSSIPEFEKQKIVE